MRRKVLIVGCWHLGSVTAACLADAGHEVHLWDQRPAVAAKWKTGTPPVFEPGLDELAKKHWGRNLFWTSLPGETVRSADWIIIAYDTPIDERDDVDIAAVEE